MIAPAALCARDFTPAPLEFNFAGMTAVVFDVLGVSSEVVPASGGGSGRGGLGGVCRHERGRGWRHSREGGSSGRRVYTRLRRIIGFGRGMRTIRQSRRDGNAE